MNEIEYLDYVDWKPIKPVLGIHFEKLQGRYKIKDPNQLTI